MPAPIDIITAVPYGAVVAPQPYNMSLNKHKKNHELKQMLGTCGYVSVRNVKRQSNADVWGPIVVNGRRVEAYSS